MFFHVLTVPLPENTIVPIGLFSQMPLALLPSQLLTDVGEDGAFNNTGHVLHICYSSCQSCHQGVWTSDETSNKELGTLLQKQYLVTTL